MLTKTGSQALRAVLALAELPPGTYAGVGNIAKKTGGAQNYLGKLLQTLCKTGIVESQKGFGGGFRLAKSPKEIAVYDVVEPIDHVSRWAGCFLGNGVCLDEKPCVIHDRWKTVRSAYLTFLMDSKVSDLVKNPT